MSDISSNNIPFNKKATEIDCNSSGLETLASLVYYSVIEHFSCFGRMETDLLWNAIWANFAEVDEESPEGLRMNPSRASDQLAPDWAPNISIPATNAVSLPAGSSRARYSPFHLTIFGGCGEESTNWGQTPL